MDDNVEPRPGWETGPQRPGQTFDPEQGSLAVLSRVPTSARIVAVAIGLLLLILSPCLVLGVFSDRVRRTGLKSIIHDTELKRGGVTLRLWMLKQHQPGRETLPEQILDFLATDPWAKENLGTAIKVEGNLNLASGGKTIKALDSAILKVTQADGDTRRLHVSFDFDSSGQASLSSASLYDSKNPAPLSSVQLNCDHKLTKGSVTLEYDVEKSVAAHGQRGAEAVLDLLTSSEKLRRTFGEVTSARGTINEYSLGNFCLRSADAKWGQLYVKFDFQTSDDNAIIKSATLKRTDGTGEVLLNSEWDMLYTARFQEKLRELRKQMKRSQEVKNQRSKQGAVPSSTQQAARAQDKPAEFFGIPCDGRRIAFAICSSGGMTDTLQHIKQELKRSIRHLGPDQQFQVIFWRGGPALEMPGGMTAATPPNRKAAFKFIDSTIPVGSKDPTDGLRAAFQSQPDVIYLLSYGEFDQMIPRYIGKLNRDGKVTVNTVILTYSNDRDNDMLKQIAKENGGTHVLVSADDLKALGGSNGRK